MLKSSSPYQLIDTKFNRPPLDRRWNSRLRLIHQMNENAAKRLTLISAPAGYGKTTLAAQWAAQSVQPTAWLSVDPSDSEPERFIRYLASAIEAVSHSFGSGIKALLASANLAPPEYLADTIIADLSMIDSHLSLVIDDFHSINDTSVQEIMIRMIQLLPANLHLVILTRMDPPWPLGKFRVREWLGELRAADLQFSRDEARIFLEPDNCGILPDVVVNTLHSRTEGWIGGLLLARQAMINATDLELFSKKFSGNDRLIVDFLIGEVISQMPPDILNFLTVTAILDRFCAALCEHLLPEGCDSRRLISEIERRNLFIVSLDNEGCWYRYHHLFQALLVQHVTSYLTTERKQQLHSLAGKWFAGQGLVEEALKHLIESGEMDAAVKLFEKLLHTVLEKDHTRRTLIRWVNMFPDEIKNTYPALLVAQIHCLTYSLNLQAMQPLLEKATALLHDPACTIEESTRQLHIANIDSQRSLYLYWLGDPEGSLRHAQQALSVLPKEHRWVYNVAVLYKAGSLAAIGRREEALTFLSETLADDCATGCCSAGPILAARMAIHIYAGHLAAVREAALQVLQIHQTVPIPLYWLSHAYYFLGSVSYEHNLLDDAENHFKYVEQNIYRVNGRVYHDCLLGLALVHQARKDPANAMEYINKSKSFAIQINDQTSGKMSDSLYARLLFMSGKKLADPISLTASNDSNKLWMEIPTLTFAEYLIQKSEPDYCNALSIINKALKQAEQHHNTRMLIQFLAVKSMALKGSGKMDQAFETLEEVLTLAEPLGFVRTFIDRGPIMHEMLKEMLITSARASYVRHLLKVFAEIPPEKHPAPSSSDNLSIKSRLTKRELETLKMLVNRLTYKEIAENLHISPETVKSHAANIYSKLNVSGRYQAIEIAKNEGFL